jgi:hypothetical protein
MVVSASDGTRGAYLRFPEAYSWAMRTRVVVAVAGVGLLALSAASGAPARTSGRVPRYALVPNTVAFSDRLHGVLGTGLESCVNVAFHCRLQGTISTTSDGGKTWRVVVRTKRPVVDAVYFHDAYEVRLDSGRVLWADSTARRWHHSATRLSFRGYCPKGWSPGITAEIVDVNIERPWSICSGIPGAGNVAKAVYRGTKRVAFTPFAAHGGSGGISVYGYPSGIAGAGGGFGIIWESRGTLYVTRDGGHRWHALPKVARPELDFGDWANTTYPEGTGFVLLQRSAGSGEAWRLIETTTAGRTWRVVHRWHERL